MAVPLIKDDHLFQLLREGNVEEFNRLVASGVSGDLTDCNFRSTDLRGVEADGLDFSGCYFRHADLRGVDLSSCRLDGASIHGAYIGGTYFPPEISADEIKLSHELGIRMRVRRQAA